MGAVWADRPHVGGRHARREGRARRAWRVVGVVLALALLGGLAASVVGLRAAGYRLYVVHTGSMTPTYRPGDLVLDGPPTSYGVGTVITFRHSDVTTDVVTHRIAAISARGITTKGDGNATRDVWTIRPDQVRGRVLSGLPKMGYLVVYLQRPAGVASVMTTALSVLLLWGLCFPGNVAARSTGHRAKRFAKARTSHSPH